MSGSYRSTRGGPPSLTYFFWSLVMYYGDGYGMEKLSTGRLLRALRGARKLPGNLRRVAPDVKGLGSDWRAYYNDLGNLTNQAAANLGQKPPFTGNYGRDLVNLYRPSALKDLVPRARELNSPRMAPQLRATVENNVANVLNRFDNIARKWR